MYGFTAMTWALKQQFVSTHAAEVIKRRVVGIHQITEIGSMDIIDEWEPKVRVLHSLLQPLVFLLKRHSIMPSTTITHEFCQAVCLLRCQQVEVSMAHCLDG